MYLRLLLGIILICSSFYGEAKILETSHIAEVLPLIDKDTWFLVDLDNTLFEAAQALGHANWFYDEMQKRLQAGMTREEAIRDCYPGWIKTQKVCRVKPLEDDFVPALIQLQHQGIIVMALTHRQPPVASATIHQIQSLGFDFMPTAPSKETFEVPAAFPTLYKQGILFVSDYNKKGDVFMPFLKMLDHNPKKIVFIDDKRKNVEELETIFSQSEIEYTGIYYTAIEKAKPIYSREIAEFQLRFLDQIMSNEAAQILMEKGIQK